MLQIMTSSVNIFKFMVLSSESCLGLGHTYPIVKNSAGLAVLPLTLKM